MFQNTHCSLVLHQTLIVSTQRGHEHETMHAFEAVNPLLPLGPLPSDIKHVIFQLTQLEQGLGNAGGSESGAKNVLIIRQVVFRKQAVDVVVVTALGVSRQILESYLFRPTNVLLDVIVECVFITALDGRLYGWVIP